jgi:hypothetical protein
MISEKAGIAQKLSIITRLAARIKDLGIRVISPCGIVFGNYTHYSNIPPTQDKKKTATEQSICLFMITLEDVRSELLLGQSDMIITQALLKSYPQIKGLPQIIRNFLVFLSVFLKPSAPITRSSLSCGDKLSSHILWGTAEKCIEE